MVVAPRTAGCLALTTAVGLALRAGLAIVVVEGDSMEPTYQSGDQLLGLRLGKRWLLAPGTIVVGDFQPRTAERSGMFVKRLIAEGPVQVRVKLQDLSPPLAVRMAACADGSGILSWQLQTGEVFVRGDSVSSADSVVWGPVSRSRIEAVVVRRLRRSRGR
jgi:signal peptidase I